MKRREFFKYSTVAAGAFAFLPLEKIFTQEVKKKYADDIVTLGKTGIKVSRLAMGTGTHGFNRRSNQTDDLGIKGLADLLYAAYEQGINFWDSADQYGTHPHMKEALKHVPREKVVILSKTRATTAEEMKEDLNRFQKEIGGFNCCLQVFLFVQDLAGSRQRSNRQAVAVGQDFVIFCRVNPLFSGFKESFLNPAQSRNQRVNS